MNKVVFTITGPTCGGKSTLEGRLVKEGFAKIVSHTTRPIRSGETDGKDYHFVSPARFVAMAEVGELVEKVEFGGNRYGASKAEFEKVFAAHKPVVLVCEPDGRRQIEAAAEREGWNLVRVFVDVPAREQARRFLDRFVGDLLLSRSGQVEANVNVYAGRLAEIMTTEHSWRGEAYMREIDDPKCAYDIILEHYDSSNEDLVVNFLSDNAFAMLADDAPLDKVMAA